MTEQVSTDIPVVPVYFTETLKALAKQSKAADDQNKAVAERATAHAPYALAAIFGYGVENEAGAVADALECFDQYSFYTREVSRGFPVAFERFKAMMNELGYDEVVYKDPVIGVDRFAFSGLKVVKTTVESKWAAKYEAVGLVS